MDQDERIAFSFPRIGDPRFGHSTADGHACYLSLPVEESYELTVTARVRPQLRAAAQPIPFSVLVFEDERDHAEYPSVDPPLLAQIDGTAIRRPIIGPWLVRALAALAVLAFLAAFVLGLRHRADYAVPLVGPPPYPADPTASARSLSRFS